MQLLFDELAIDLPALFGPGTIDLIPMPPATPRTMIDALGDPMINAAARKLNIPSATQRVQGLPDVTNP